jgi:hypothetical protein
VLQPLQKRSHESGRAIARAKGAALAPPAGAIFERSRVQQSVVTAADTACFGISAHSARRPVVLPVGRGGRECFRRIRPREGV